MKIYFLMPSLLNKVIPWLWAAVWFTLPVSMKANAFNLILLGLAAVIQALVQKPVIQRQQLILVALFFLFFIWHAASFFFDPDKYEVWKSLERKLSLLAIPVIMLLIGSTGKDLGKWAIRGFFSGLVLTGMHMLSVALVHLAMGRPIASFTYHEFTSPYTIGAIYYSCLLSAALYFLAFRKVEKMINRFRLPLGIFFLILLLFCASKLFIVITIPAVLWPLIQKFLKEKGLKRYMLPVLVLLVIIIGSIPFFSRLSELKNTDLKIVRQPSYTYDTPLNGLTFRMILWRFAGEILRDENAWFTGTGIGSRQEVLNTYYADHGLYTGNPDLGDQGYLGYNFHSQYLEVLVGTGIPGLVILLAIIFFIFITDRDKLFFPLMVYFVIIIFLITESMLERQAGIVFFCLLWTMRVQLPHKLE